MVISPLMVGLSFCLDFQQSSLSFVLGLVFDGLTSNVSNSNFWMILVSCVKLLHGSISINIPRMTYVAHIPHNMQYLITTQSQNECQRIVNPTVNYQSTGS